MGAKKYRQNFDLGEKKALEKSRMGLTKKSHKKNEPILNKTISSLFLS